MTLERFSCGSKSNFESISELSLSGNGQGQTFIFLSPLNGSLKAAASGPKKSLRKKTFGSVADSDYACHSGSKKVTYSRYHALVPSQHDEGHGAQAAGATFILARLSNNDNAVTDGSVKEARESVSPSWPACNDDGGAVLVRSARPEWL